MTFSISAFTSACGPNQHSVMCIWYLHAATGIDRTVALVCHHSNTCDRRSLFRNEHKQLGQVVLYISSQRKPCKKCLARAKLACALSILGCNTQYPYSSGHHDDVWQKAHCKSTTTQIENAKTGLCLHASAATEQLDFHSLLMKATSCVDCWPAPTRSQRWTVPSSHAASTVLPSYDTAV